nr:hypothetical protein [Gemmatimonadota bacterium]
SYYYGTLTLAHWFEDSIAITNSQHRRWCPIRLSTFRTQCRAKSSYRSSLKPASTAGQISELLGRSRNAGSLVICAPVYAELLAHPKASQSFVDGFLLSTDVQIDFAMDEAIWRDIARGFADYSERRRQTSGTHAKRLLVDFMIGAHAVHRADRLMTLERDRYRLDFPALTLVPSP